MNFKKYLINSSNPISRFLARFLDYSLFYSCFILPLFFTSLLDSDILHLASVILIPLFWIPFEALSTHFFGATPGKSLFGLSVKNKYQNKLTLKESFGRAFSIWKGMGGNFPVLNLFLMAKRFKEIRVNGRLNLDSNSHVHIYQRRRRSIRSIIGSFLVGLFSLFFILEYEVREVVTSSNQEFFSGKLFKGGNDLNWNAYKDPEGNFEIHFPGKPEEKFTQLPIPKSKDTLPFHSVNYITDKDGIEYNLNYTTLPENWLKWRPALLLKGSLKIISSTISQGKILKKSCKDYKNLPALEFIIEKKNNRECAGRLILIDNVLYKIEVNYPKEKQEAIEESLTTFLQSFNPING